VAELVEAVGVGPDTIRYYERVGLLPPPARTPAGYRAYDPGAVDHRRPAAAAAESSVFDPLVMVNKFP
jgi:DNA-binding transcriptional MerR regulator